MLKNRLIIIRNYFSYGLVGESTGHYFKEKELFIGDRVLVFDKKKESFKQGHVVIIGDNITVTGFNNKNISSINIVEIKKPFTYLKENDLIYGNELTIKKIK